MRERLKWSDVKMLRTILVVLDTQSWACQMAGALEDEINDDTAEGKEAVEYITAHFREPVEATGMSLATIQDEAEEIFHYDRKYLSIGTEDYQKIWYKLCSAPDVEKWPNMLRISQLLFSLPFSSGQIEKMFSALKVIKTDQRTNLQTETLLDLLEINMEGPNLSSFSADEAVALWWEDCKMTCGVNQAPSKDYKPKKSSNTPSTSSVSQAESDVAFHSESESPEVFTLEDWDKWFGPPSPPLLVEPEVDSDSD